MLFFISLTLSKLLKIQGTISPLLIAVRPCFSIFSFLSHVHAFKNKSPPARPFSLTPSKNKVDPHKFIPKKEYLVFHGLLSVCKVKFLGTIVILEPTSNGLNDVSKVLPQ